jgi:hypothetical protein
MFATDFYIDRPIAPSDLSVSFAEAFGLKAFEVEVALEQDYTAIGDAWDHSRTKAVLATSSMPGDFPLVVRAGFRGELSDRFDEIASRIACHLPATVMTNEVDGPEDFAMASPDGEISFVYVDDDALGAADPAIILVPQSRAIYEAHLRQETRPLATA